MKTKHLAITFGICCLLLSIGLHYCTPRPKHKPNNNDSLKAVILSQDKYLGLVLIELNDANRRRVDAELKLQERKPIYIERIRVIREQAPDTCQPYLDAMAAECDTIVMGYDTLVSKYKVEVMKADTVINALQSNNETLKHFNNKLEAEVKQSDKKARRAKFVSKLVGWLSVGIIGVITFITIVK